MKTSHQAVYADIGMTNKATFAQGTVPTPVPLDVLFDICRRPRFANSSGEAYVIEKYIDAIEDIKTDAFGNYWLVIPDGGKNPTTMFSSHTDTVHKSKAENIPYKLRFKNGWLSVDGGGVLGADDGTGIWIMLNLIKAKVPGLYIFHREEEIGGRGSSFIADNHASLIRDEFAIKHCIAFDRKGTSHVITHQGCGRCCSDEFAIAFAKQLNLGTEFRFAPNDGGSFTDSANYIELIGECTNLSVGYYDQHSQQESQDLTFVTRLVNKLIGIDFSQLPQTRQPGEEDPDDFDAAWVNYNRSYTTQSTTYSFEDTAALVAQYPGEIADLLCSIGYDHRALIEELEDTYGCTIGIDPYAGLD